MNKYCILLSGPTANNDEELIAELQINALVLKNSDNNQIESILKNHKIDLILFEITKKNHSDVEAIKNIKNQFPNIPIILIDGNGDREVMVKAFDYGIKDAFKKPYKCHLIAERVNAFLRRQGSF
jgi:DNA-binding response OmpR family regulator